jgi:hypothetical protein
MLEDITDKDMAYQLTVQAAATISAANTAAAAAANTSTALAALVSSANSTAQHNGGVAVPTPTAVARDPMLTAFENYLLQNMRASDVVSDEEGILLFNVNQVAYLMEKSVTKDQQKTTKKRIKDAMNSAGAVTRRCSRTGNGER